MMRVPNDNEARVRAALAASFPPVEHETPPWSPPRGERRRTFALASMLAAAAVVAALAIALTASRSHDSAVGSETTPAPTPVTASPTQQLDTVPATLEGTMWLLTQLSGIHGSVDLAKDHPAFVSGGMTGAFLHLSRSGAFGAEDTVNHWSGRFALTGDELRLTPQGETYADYAGHDPWRIRVINAIADLASGKHPILVGGSREQLVLSTDGYTFIFRNHGPVTDDPLPQTTQPSPTPTHVNEPFPQMICPSTTLIRQTGSDPALTFVSKQGTARAFSCQYSGPGSFDAMTINIVAGSTSYDKAMVLAGVKGTVSAVSIGDRAFRAPFSIDGHPADNFGEQRGNTVVLIAVVGPAANVDSEELVAALFVK